MIRKEIETVSYNCERLEDETQVTLEYLYHGEDLHAIYPLDCEYSRICGVEQEDKSGQWTYKWELCPALEKTKKK
jgi:hypothetical protein